MRPLDGRRVSSKSPSRVRECDAGVAGRNEREKYFPQYDGSLNYPPGKSMIFFIKKKQRYKNVIAAIPDGGDEEDAD